MCMCVCTYAHTRTYTYTHSPHTNKSRSVSRVYTKFRSALTFINPAIRMDHTEADFDTSWQYVRRKRHVSSLYIRLSHPSPSYNHYKPPLHETRRYKVDPNVSVHAALYNDVDRLAAAPSKWLSISRSAILEMAASGCYRVWETFFSRSDFFIFLFQSPRTFSGGCRSPRSHKLDADWLRAIHSLA